MIYDQPGLVRQRGTRRHSAPMGESGERARFDINNKFSIASELGIIICIGGKVKLWILGRTNLKWRTAPYLTEVSYVKFMNSQEI